jgi:hypothetical protein
MRTSGREGRPRSKRRVRINRGWIAFALICSGLGGAIAGRVSKIAHRKALQPTGTGAALHQRVAGALDVVDVIYDGKLGENWQDWGWGRHDLSKPGPARVVFGGYAGIVLHHPELPSDFGALAFRFKAPKSWAPFLVVSLKHVQKDDSNFPAVEVGEEDVTDVGRGWSEARIAWPRLNPHNLAIDRVVFSATRQVGNEWVELDKIVLTRRDAKAGQAPVRDTELAILCQEPTTPINPMIYGISWSAWGSGGTAHRIGGNPITRLNWDLGAVWNAGKDWFFENGSGTGSVPEWVDDALAHHAVSAVTVPMLGWVAKDKTSVGFPVSKLGQQKEHDPNRPDAGNGEAPNGTKLRPGPPTETSVPAPPEKVARWVAALRDKDRTRSSRAVLMYILDNEPSLWNEVHRDVRPEPLGYDELLQRTISYATAIRGADPETPIAGPAEWGWTGYFSSGKDRALSPMLRPDRRAHGDVPLVAWYLQKLAEYEKVKGVRLLDVLDLHFYPQAERIFGANARVDPEGAALRLRSTRALWDPKYVDESWIHEPIRLIPRMHEWVAQNYPGRKTSLGEWSFGADDHMSGALATAEALGRFGQHGLDSAFYWGGPKPGSRTFWAFRAFRDFDGRGGHFLDLSVPTTEAEGVSFFASRDQSGAHVVALIVNLDPSFAVRARIKTDACGRITVRRAFTYAGDPSGIAPEPASTVGGEPVELVPPYSIRVLDLSVTPAR